MVKRHKHAAAPPRRESYTALREIRSTTGRQAVRHARQPTFESASLGRGVGGRNVARGRRVRQVV